MDPNDFLVTRLNQITEVVVQQNWQRAHELISEWESDDRLSTIPYDGWYVDSDGIQFGDLDQCLS